MDKIVKEYLPSTVIALAYVCFVHSYHLLLFYSNTLYCISVRLYSSSRICSFTGGRKAAAILTIFEYLLNTATVSKLLLFSPIGIDFLRTSA